MGRCSNSKMDEICGDCSFINSKKRMPKVHGNWVLAILLLFCACLSACSKTNDVPAEIRAQLVIDDKIITKYLADNDLTSKAKVVDSSGVSTGIYYIIDTAGTGSAIFTNSTSVTVSYTGNIISSSSTLGAQFTSSGTNYHPSFVLGSVIRGWQLGIPEMKQGGTMRLYLPSHYAYGPFAQPTIGLPANSVTVFTIKLYTITN